MNEIYIKEETYSLEGIKQEVVDDEELVCEIKPDPCIKSEWVDCLLCNECGYETTCKNDYKSHLATHDIDDCQRTLSCVVCEYMADSRDELDEHVKTHSQGKIFRCYKCRYQTAGLDMLKRHLREHPPATEKVQCNMCAYSCWRRSDLKRHVMRTHSPVEYQSRCDKCDYKTYSSNGFRLHKLKHRKKEVLTFVTL